MKDFPLVSVIIPVYRAVEFVETAVLSAIQFPIVGEVILIEDGSNDGSLEKCLELEINYKKVILITHEFGKNLGAAASRNKGILKSKLPYIAFLDADDYFLPNRFKEFLFLIDSQVEFDGIYEPIQYFNGSDKIYGISKRIPPEKLFHFLIRGTYGHMHTNGIIVKKNLLKKSGLFVESLDLHEDSDLWIKLAFYGRLLSNNTKKPVAMVRRHEGNRIWKGTNAASRYNQLKITWAWAKTENIGLINKLLLLKKLIAYLRLSKY